MISRRWSAKSPTVSGRYMYREVNGDGHIHYCRVTVRDDGSREISGDEDDTVDKLSKYEFKGPL
jgi:hypothetical protein